MKLAMNSELTRKQGFKLKKKIEKIIYVRNINGTINKKRPIENIIKINIYYQKYRKRIKTNMIRGQKQSIILEILWLACHNPEINWRIGETKMTRCPEECGKQQRLKQRKLKWQKQKKEEKKQEEKKKKEKTKKGENNGSEKSGRRIGDLEQEGRSSKV